MAEEKKAKYELDKIMDELDPNKVNEKVELKHREARRKYELKKSKVDEYDEFMDEVTKYVQHHHKEIFDSELPEHIASGRARRLIEAIYEKKGGLAGARDEARKGNMAKVLDGLASALESDERAHYVQHVMNQVDPQDFDGHVQLVKQYTSKYGEMLPKDFKAKTPEELANQYEGLIKHHIDVVEQAKTILEKYEPAKKEKKELKKAA